MTQLELETKEPLLSEKPTAESDEQDRDSDEPGGSDDEAPAQRTPRRRGRRRANYDDDHDPNSPSSARRRFLFIACFFLAIWLAYSVHLHRARKAKKLNVIYASRYSKEYKYRPAASPIITETLKDGRVRLRGATPPPETPTPTPTKKARRTRKKGGNRKKKKSSSKSK